jgi:FkbM family methyltransferase
MQKVMKGLILLANDPKLLFLRFYKKMRIIFPLPKSPVVKKITGGGYFRFDFDYDHNVKLMYLGVYEIETVEVMKRIIKKGDVFIDVGANIGYITAIALGLVGENGSVHSFEPVPDYFLKLKDVAILNNKSDFVLNQLAVGSEQGTISIAVTNLSNIGWNTVVPGFMSDDTIKETFPVSICRLDRYIKEKGLNGISLIKIDTEGFEFPVLKGLSGYFNNNRDHPAILCEIAPAAYPLLGYKLEQLAKYMDEYDYKAFDVIGVKKKVELSKLKNTTNVLFLWQGKELSI